MTKKRRSCHIIGAKEQFKAMKLKFGFIGTKQLKLLTVLEYIVFNKT